MITMGDDPDVHCRRSQSNNTFRSLYGNAIITNALFALQTN